MFDTHNNQRLESYSCFPYTDDADDEITIWINGRSRITSTNGAAVSATESSNLLIKVCRSCTSDKQVA